MQKTAGINLLKLFCSILPRSEINILTTLYTIIFKDNWVIYTSMLKIRAAKIFSVNSTYI